MRLFVKFLLFISAIAINAGCVAQMQQNVPLVWKPTNDVYNLKTTSLTNLYSKKVSIKQFKDKRENKSEFGKYVEDGNNLPVTTKDDVSSWCSETLKLLLKQYGVTFDDNNPDIVLKGEILNFYVTEDKTYKSSVGIKIIAEGPTGNVLWQGIMAGTNKRFGRSYQLENYYETISDAYLEAVAGLLQNSEFVLALK